MYILAKLIPLSANHTKWSNKAKQFFSCCGRIVWVCLVILWGWHLKGYVYWYPEVYLGSYQISIMYFFFFFLQNFIKFEQTGHIIIEMFRQIYLKISTLITLKVDDKIWNGFLEGFYNRNVFHDKDSCFQLINLSKLFFRSFWDDFVNLAWILN